MKNKITGIPHFALSPGARGGMMIKRLDQNDLQTEHDHKRPHRDDHYLLMFATAGRFQLDLDFHPVTVQAPAVLIIFPGQVHQLKQVEDPGGWAISFDPALLPAAFLNLTERDISGPLSVVFSDGLYRHLLALLPEMEMLQNHLSLPYRTSALQALLNAVLCLILGAYDSGAANPEQQGRAAVIERDFFSLLKHHYKDWKKPSQYADALNITVAHLYDTVKGMTGISVSEHIQQYCMLEARRLLCYSSQSVREIGYQLGYEEPAYFGRLFKKVAGLTPMQFRAQFRD